MSTLRRGESTRGFVSFRWVRPGSGLEGATVGRINQVFNADGTTSLQIAGIFDSFLGTARPLLAGST